MAGMALLPGSGVRRHSHDRAEASEFK